MKKRNILILFILLSTNIFGQLILTPDSTDATCGICDGTGTVNVTGGSGSYTYQWNAAAASQTTPTATSLCPGPYTVIVTDVGGTTTLWSEDFGLDAACSNRNQLATAATLANGSWTQFSPGTQGAIPNEWFISATEAGMGTGNCGDGCLGTPALTNQSLHVGSGAVGLCAGGDCGAAYNAGTNGETHKHIQSPTINLTGANTITLSFDYMHGGEVGLDEAQLMYFDGIAWSNLGVLPVTTCCGAPCGTLFAQGQWSPARYSTVLPASANNNPSVKIGFLWDNDDNNSGADPSFAVDDITLTEVSAAIVDSITITILETPLAVTLTTNSPICENQALSLSASPSGLGAGSYSWVGPNGPFGGAGLSTVNIMPFPTPISGGWYYVTVDDGTCAGTDSAFVISNSTYTIFDTTTICSGNNFTYADGTVSNNILVDESHNSSFNTIAGCDSIIREFLVVSTSLPSVPLIDTIGSICTNVNAILTAIPQNGGTINWYSDVGLTTNVGIGNVLNLGNVTTFGEHIYYVTETVGGCVSLGVAYTFWTSECPPYPCATNLITNGDFENYLSCPDDGFSIHQDSAVTVTDWENGIIDIVSGSALTPDYYNQNCGFFGSGTYSAPYDSPNGQGYAGFLSTAPFGSADKEMLGMMYDFKECQEYSLQLKMVQGTTLFLSAPLTTDIVIYGGVSGGLPLLSPTICPLAQGFEIMATIPAGTIDSIWRTYDLVFTPSGNYDCFIIGADCTNPSTGLDAIFVDDVFLCVDACANMVTNISPINLASDTCSTNTGSASVNFTTNCYTGFDFNWLDGSLTTVSTDSIALGLAAGTYTVEVTDSNGCVINTMVTIPNNCPTTICSGNLVNNPSFEDTTFCPTVFGQITAATGWSNPTSGTPDYLNSCNSGNVNVPNAIWGYQPALTGNGMTHLICYYPGQAVNWREYMQTQLSSPLVAGQAYSVSFNVVCTHREWIIDGIGAYLSATAPSQGNALVFSPAITPQISNPLGNILSDTLNWTTISGTFIAAGGEQYLTIGNFFDDATISVQFLQPGVLEIGSYYIDDVCVIPVITNLNVNDASICEGDSVLLTASGSLTGYNWIDSITSLQLGVTDSFYMVSPLITTTYGVYSATDTAYTTVTVYNNSSVTNVLTGCTGFSITVNGNPYDSTGIYTDTLVGANVNGCDSIIITDLTIDSITTGMQILSECDGFSIVIGANTYTITGLYTDTLPNASVNGCDSILTTDLTILPLGTSTTVLNECDGFSITINGNPYTATGVYNDTILNAGTNGCDSIVITDLTISPLASSTDTLIECIGFTITINGNPYDSTGIYTDILPNAAANGCDSIVITDLTIHEEPIVGVGFNTSLCLGDPSVDLFPLLGGADLGGVWSPVLNSGTGLFNPQLDTAGNYNYVINNAPCPADSSTVEVAINASPTLSITQEDDNCQQGIGSITTVPLTGAEPFTYTWSPASTDSALTGLIEGTYTLIVVDSLACKNTYAVDILNLEFDCDYHIYLPNVFSPNGDGENDILYVKGKGIETINLTIYNRWGNKVFESNDLLQGWDGTYNGNEQGNGVFVYYITATFIKGKTVEDKGNVSIVK